MYLTFFLVRARRWFRSSLLSPRSLFCKAAFKPPGLQTINLHGAFQSRWKTYIYLCWIYLRHTTVNYCVATAEENNIDSSSCIFFSLNSEHLISQIHLEFFEWLHKFRLSCNYHQHTVEWCYDAYNSGKHSLNLLLQYKFQFGDTWFGKLFKNW